MVIHVDDYWVVQAKLVVNPNNPRRFDVAKHHFQFFHLIEAKYPLAKTKEGWKPNCMMWRDAAMAKLAFEYLLANNPKMKSGKDVRLIHRVTTVVEEELQQ